MEHRLSPRKQLNVPVTVHLADASSHCLSHDVNADGIFVRGPLPCIRVNTPVKLTIGDLGDSALAAFKAMVVRIDRDGVGLMFDKTESAIYSLLEASLRAHHCYMRVVPQVERSAKDGACVAA